MVMLRAYCDLGAKGDSTDTVVSVASVIFKPPAYKQFVRPWNRMLKRWGASAFHATDFYPGAKEFNRYGPEPDRLFEEDSRRIPRMIADHVYRIVVVAFKPKEFMQLAPPDWKNAYGTSVHSHAIQLCVLSNGWWRKRVCPHESFAYFMEAGGPDEGQVTNAVSRMQEEHNETARIIGVSSFSIVKKGLARGLEAADFVAWQFNKHYIDKVLRGQGDIPRKDFEAFVGGVEDKFEYLFMTKEKLRYLFALQPYTGSQ